MALLCSYCYREFGSEEDKWDHEMIAHICHICFQHDRDCPHRRQCLHCDRKFHSRQALWDHEAFDHTCDICMQHERVCECRRAMEQEILEINQTYPPRQPETYRFGEIDPSWFATNGNFNPPQGGEENEQGNNVSTLKMAKFRILFGNII